MKHLIEFNEEKHEYKVDSIIKMGVNAIIDGAGLRPPYRGLAKYGIRGTNVHSICQYYDENRLNGAGEYQGYLDSYIKYLALYNPFYYQIEQIQYSEKYDYCGTPDRIGFIKKRLVIIDIKSGVPTKTDGIQLYGYQLLQDKPEKYMLYDLYLNKNGDMPKLVLQNKPIDRNVFMAALTIKSWKGK